MRRAWCIRALVGGLCVSPALASAQISDDSGWFAPDAPAASAHGRLQPAPLEPTVHDVVDTDPRALSEFRPLLDKYGDWVEDTRYGLVWVPARRWVGDDFAPYLTRGHWALDTAGDWVWVSDYAFGPVVFHYGRWVWVVGLGWAWVPGYQYAPAWVSWRVPMHGGLYVGWAPMPPSYVWVSGVAVGVGFYVMTPWVFCPSYYVFSPHVHSHRVHDPSRMKEAARQTKPYHPQVGARGPSPASMGVPSSRVPAARLPAAPKPAKPVDTLRHAPIPPLSASERAGVGTLPRVLPAPKPAPRMPGSTSARVPQTYSIAPRTTREPVSVVPWQGSSRTPGAGYVRSTAMQGPLVLPRTTVAPQTVAPPRAPVPVAPAPVRAAPAPSRSAR